MFGLSLSKLLLTAFIVFMVWLIFKKIGAATRGGRPGLSRADKIRRAAEEAVRGSMGARSDQSRPQAADNRPEDRKAPASLKTLDMVPCPSCGNWNEAGSVCACGQRTPG